jgi:Ca2+-binding RTX toxin-like protein
MELTWSTYDLDTYNMVPLDVTVYGQAGNDTIYGSDVTGNVYLETILGGADNDTIFAGSGDDLVYGGVGNDTIQLQGGDDECYGESGADTINGGSGNDEIVGGITAGEGNTLFGDGGNDTLCDEAGSFALTNSQDGGFGSDFLWIDGLANYTSLDGGPGVTDECVSIAGATLAFQTQCESILTTKPTFCP